MDGGLSAVPSVVSSAIKLLQVVFEIKAVSEQVQDLLKTTNDLDEKLRSAKTLRRQKEAVLEPAVKEWIDTAIRNAATAIDSVAELIEANRVEMEINRKKQLRDPRRKQPQDLTPEIGLKTRAVFVLVDSPKVAERLTKLSVASQGLWQAIGTMSTRHDHLTCTSATLQRSNSNGSKAGAKSPPTYYESEYWAHKGVSNTRRVTKHRYGVQHIPQTPRDGGSTPEPAVSGEATPSRTSEVSECQSLIEDNASAWDGLTLETASPAADSASILSGQVVCKRCRAPRAFCKSCWRRLEP